MGPQYLGSLVFVRAGINDQNCMNSITSRVGFFAELVLQKINKQKTEYPTFNCYKKLCNKLWSEAYLFIDTNYVDLWKKSELHATRCKKLQKK